MRQIKVILISVILILGYGELKAQEATLASGGDAAGSGGSSSYSVGQLLYATHTGSNGSMAHGVQQAFEVSVIIGIAFTEITLDIKAYPNPVSHFLILNIGNYNQEQLRYQLYDMQGKLLDDKLLSSQKETIVMDGLPRASYFLKVTHNTKIVKTFKIIKN